MKELCDPHNHLPMDASQTELTKLSPRSVMIDFGKGFASAVAGLLVAGLFFRSHLFVVGVFLAALGLMGRLNTATEANRRRILEHKTSAWSANYILAIEVTALFVGIFFGAFIVQWILPKFLLFPMLNQIKGPRHLDWLGLYKHNVQVLLGCFLIAVGYRSGGGLLVISWMGMHWSRSILGNIFTTFEPTSLWVKILSVLAILPHLILEALAYVLAAMAGVFLSKAAMKYEWHSPIFTRVIKACLVFIFLGCLLLFTAALVEDQLFRRAMAHLL